MKWKKEYTPAVQALAGASKFTINGGHFNVVGGNVYSYSEEGPNKDSSWNRDEFIKIFKQHLQSGNPTDIGQGFFDSLMYEKERKENFIIRSSGWRSCRVQSPTNNLNTEACQHLQTPMATNACGMSQNEDGSSDRIADSSAQFRTEAIANVVLGSELEPTTKAKRSRKRRIRKNKHQQYPKSEYNLNDLLFGTLSPRGSLGNPELVPIPSLNVQVPPIIGDTAVSSSTGRGLFQETTKSIGIALPNYQGVADAKKTATTTEKFDFGNTCAMLSSSCQTTTSGMVAGVVSPEPVEPQESCESNKYCKISLPSTAEEIKVSGSAIQTADRDVHSTTTHSKCVNTTFNNCVFPDRVQLEHSTQTLDSDPQLNTRSSPRTCTSRDTSGCVCHRRGRRWQVTRFSHMFYHYLPPPTIGCPGQQWIPSYLMPLSTPWHRGYASYMCW